MTFFSSNFFPWALKSIFLLLVCEESKSVPCPACPTSFWCHCRQIICRLQLLGNSLWQHQGQEKLSGSFPLWHSFVQKQCSLWVRFSGVVCLEMGVVKAEWVCVTARAHQAGSLPTAWEGEPWTILCSQLENSSLYYIYIYICLKREAAHPFFACMHAVLLWKYCIQWI